MNPFATPVSELIRRRFSCRIYSGESIDEARQQTLKEAIDALPARPFGSAMRFALVAAAEEDRSELRGLGAYGSIRGASGFIVGAVRSADKDLEDFGYVLEHLVLRTTELELGTCWLGGFTKNTFARSISAQRGEQVPAVAAVGVMREADLAKSRSLRHRISGDKRLTWESLFFDGRFGVPLSPDKAGEYGEALEMVRIGPSASNKQPWRVVNDGAAFHFYMQRTPGYATRFLARLVGAADLQRLDMGIAMYHFETVAAESGRKGAWVVKDPGLEKPDALTEYVVSWVS